MIRILIADDHPIVRQGIKQVLEEAPDMKVVGEAETAQEVLAKAHEGEHDLLILDISMPGRPSLEILQDLKSQCPKLPVLILSMYPEDQYGVRAFKAGAAGYMTKETVPAELHKAVRKIVNGGRYVTPGLAEKLAAEVDPISEKSPQELLSEREYLVLCRLAQGQTVSHLADELSLSVKTISTYRTRILEKIKVKNNVELTHYALRHRLLP
jgi:two-component system invasion response regulator UvrY